MSETFIVNLLFGRYSCGISFDPSAPASAKDTLKVDWAGSNSAPILEQGPLISGSTVTGQTLTATHGTYLGTITSYSGFWYSNTTLVQTGGLTYVTQAGDNGNNITYQEYATNSTFGNSATGVSNAIGPIGGGIVAPVQTAAPSIAGSSVQGATITATPGTYTGTVTGYTRQWFAAATLVQTGGLTYITQPADISKTITFQESAYNVNPTYSSATGTSNGIGPITASTWGGVGTLAAPALSFLSSNTTNPVTVQISIPADSQVGNTIKIGYQTSLPFGSPTIVSHTVTATDLTNRTISFPLPSFSTTAGTITYIQALMNDGSHDSQYLSNIVTFNDTTAPIITTSSTQTITEQTQLALALAATDTGGVPALVSPDGIQSGWFISGGADQLNFQLAVVSGNVQVQFAGNGTMAYAMPVNFPPNAANPYVFKVACIDYGGNTSAQVTINLSVTQINQTPNPFSFVNVSNAAHSTLFQAGPDYTGTSSGQPLSGMQAGFNIPASVAGTGFQYSKNGGAWTNPGSFTIQNGDKIDLQVTSGATDGVNQTCTVNIGNPVAYSTQWLVSTPFAPSALFQSGEEGYALDPATTSHFWQDTAGTVAGAFGSNIARVDDIGSTFTNNFTQGTGANQPGSVSPGWMSFDGTDDVLTLASSLLYPPSNSGAWTIIAAVQASSPASDSVWWDEGSTVNANGVWEPGTRITASTQDLTVFEENNAGGQNGNNSAALFGLTAWNNAGHIVSLAGTTASGNMTVEAWVDRVTGSSHTTYSYGMGTPTLAVTGIGAAMRATASRWFNGKIGRFIAINRTLTSAERAAAEAWCASPYGISLP